MDSSRTDVCSGDEPCLEGSWAVRDSFSTWIGMVSYGGLFANPHSALTAISKSTNLSVYVLISLSKQNL